MKRVFATILLLAIIQVSFAQRTKTKEVTITSFVHSYLNYPGQLKYQYIVDEEGYHIWNGPVTINGTSNESFGDFDEMRVKSSFSLASNFTNGIINGPISVVNEAVASSWDKTETYSYSFSGSFYFGAPDGVFKIRVIEPENNQNISITYSKGILTSIGMLEGFKGSINNKGEITGIRKYDLGDEDEFLNGVLVLESKDGKDTPPQQEELARQFAVGSISEKQLLQEGFVVKEDNFDYGEEVGELLLSDEFGDWADLLEIDNISFDSKIIYRYLERAVFISESEIERIVNGNPSIVKYFKPFFEDDEFPYLIRFHNGSNIEERLVTKEQKERLDSLIHEKEILASTISFKQYLVSRNLISPGEYNIISKADRFFNDTVSYPSVQNYYLFLLRLKKIVDNTPDIRLLKWDKNVNGDVFIAGNQYISVESVENYINTIAAIKEYMIRRVDHENRLFEDRMTSFKKSNDDQEQRVRSALYDAFNFLKPFKKASAIVNSNRFSLYFDTDAMPVKEWKTVIEPYAPFLSCMISSIHLSGTDDKAYANVWVTSKDHAMFELRFNVTNGKISGIYTSPVKSYEEYLTSSGLISEKDYDIILNSRRIFRFDTPKAVIDSSYAIIKGILPHDDGSSSSRWGNAPDDLSLYVIDGNLITVYSYYDFLYHTTYIQEFMKGIPQSSFEDIDSEAIPFMIVETKPSFMGGDATAFTNWVMSQLVYPEIAKENGISGRVVTQFTVEKDGSVTNVKVLRGVDEALDKEAVRVIKSSPKWSPGKDKGRAARVTFTFPVIFQLR